MVIRSNFIPFTDGTLGGLYTTPLRLIIIEAQPSYSYLSRSYRLA